MNNMEDVMFIQMCECLLVACSYGVAGELGEEAFKKWKEDNKIASLVAGGSCAVCLFLGVVTTAAIVDFSIDQVKHCTPKKSTPQTQKSSVSAPDAKSFKVVSHTPDKVIVALKNKERVKM